MRNFRAAIERLHEVRTGAASTPSVQHVRFVEAQIDAIARGDFLAAVANCSDDLELEILAPSELPFIRRARGKADVAKAMDTNFNSVVQQNPTLTSVVTQGDILVLFGRESGVIRESGAAYEVEFVHRFTFEGEKLKAIRILAAKTDRPTS